MTASARQRDRMLKAAADAHKPWLDLNFRTGPVFRMGFDAHVRAWKRAVRLEVYVRYQTDASFANALDQRRDELCAVPMPPMADREWEAL